MAHLANILQKSISTILASSLLITAPGLPWHQAAAQFVQSSRVPTRVQLGIGEYGFTLRLQESHAGLNKPTGQFGFSAADIAPKDLVLDLQLESDSHAGTPDLTLTSIPVDNSRDRISATRVIDYSRGNDADALRATEIEPASRVQVPRQDASGTEEHGSQLVSKTVQTAKNGFDRVRKTEAIENLTHPAGSSAQVYNDPQNAAARDLHDGSEGQGKSASSETPAVSASHPYATEQTNLFVNRVDSVSGHSLLPPLARLQAASARFSWTRNMAASILVLATLAISQASAPFTSIINALAIGPAQAQDQGTTWFYWTGGGALLGIIGTVNLLKKKKLNRLILSNFLVMDKDKLKARVYEGIMTMTSVVVLGTLLGAGIFANRYLFDNLYWIMKPWVGMEPNLLIFTSFTLAYLSPFIVPAALLFVVNRIAQRTTLDAVFKIFTDKTTIIAMGIVAGILVEFMIRLAGTYITYINLPGIPIAIALIIRTTLQDLPFMGIMLGYFLGITGLFFRNLAALLRGAALGMISGFSLILLPVAMDTLSVLPWSQTWHLVLVPIVAGALSALFNAIGAVLLPKSAFVRTVLAPVLLSQMGIALGLWGAINAVHGINIFTGLRLPFAASMFILALLAVLGAIFGAAVGHWMRNYLYRLLYSPSEPN